MASLQTLRDKGGVIVAVVIGISLLAFILGDVLSSGGGFFSRADGVATVNGTEVTAQEYQRELAVLGEVYKSRGGVSAFGDRMQEMISQEAFQNLLVRYGIEPELDAVGVSIGAEELTELLVGNNPAPMIREFFSDPQTGLFDAEIVRNFVANLSSDQTGAMQLVWNDIQDNVKEQAQVMKFKQLVDRGAFITDAQVDFYAQLGATTYTINYIAQNAADMDKESVTITDAQIQDFYNKNQSRFEQEETRTINYVAFDILPSEADFAEATDYIAQLEADFATTDNARQFAEFNSEEQYDNTYYKREELTADLADFAFGRQTGDVFSPEIIDNQYTLYRVADVQNIPDSVEFEYVIIDPSLKSQTDSLMRVMNRRGANFQTIAADFTAKNSGAVHNGGSTGVIDPQSIPAELLLPVSEMRRGQIQKIELPTGDFIIKMNQTKNINRKVQLAKVVYNVDPSDKTRADVRQKAIEFAATAQANGFASTANDQMIFARTEVVYPHSHSMQAFKDSRDAVRWAFNAEVGAQSDILEYDNTYVVALVSNANQEGTTPLSEVKGVINTILTNQELVAQAAKKLQGGNVQTLAQTLDTEMMTENGVNFLAQSYSAGMYDPAVIGATAALTQGQTSTPVSGNQAAYLVEVVETDATAQSPLMIKERIKAEQAQYLFQGAYKTLMQNLDINDTRYRFF